jgi:tetratricopeptide (TPR) repeat protein
MFNIEKAKQFFESGIDCYNQNNYVIAEDYFELSLKNVPDRISTLINLAATKIKLNNYEEAEYLSKKIINLDEKEYMGFMLLAVTNIKKNDYEEALNLLDVAYKLNPNSAEVNCNKGIAFLKKGRINAAFDSLTKSIEIDGKNIAALCNLSIVYFELARIRDAKETIEKALAINSNDAECNCNYGIILMNIKEIYCSLRYFDNAISLKNNYIDAYWNKALALLMDGQYLEGWKLYEYRFQLENFKKNKKIFYCPQWNGKESIADKYIYIYAEQGYGDTIQFIRYVKLLQELKAKIVIEIPENLAVLLNGMEGIQVVASELSNLPSIDYHCALLSLPYVFKTEINTIPSSGKYIYPCKTKSLEWRKKIGNSRRLKIGLVWSGGTRENQLDTFATNIRRNIPLSIFAKYFQNIECDFYSLQKGEPSESELYGNELLYWPNGNFFNFTKELKDFSDTAALIDNLDLVISVDTSTAHLSAAMGKKTWILNRYDSCWRWLIDRKDSPWYSSVTLYRQDETYNWEKILIEVEKDLISYKNYGRHHE